MRAQPRHYLPDEPVHCVHIRAIIHHAGKNDCAALTERIGEVQRGREMLHVNTVIDSVSTQCGLWCKADEQLRFGTRDEYYGMTAFSRLTLERKKRTTLARVNPTRQTRTRLGILAPLLRIDIHHVQKHA